MSNLSSHILALLPLILICGAIVAVIAVIAVRRHHFLSATVTAIGLNAALISLVGVLTVTPIQVTPFFVFDDYFVAFAAMVLVAALACSTLGYAYLETLADHREEFYILLLCSTGGALALAASRNLASLFIGYELLSVPLFGLIAYTYRSRISLEAGFKYLVLSSAASAFLLFGIALLYAASGTLTFSGLTAVTDSGGAYYSWVLMGMGMILAALGFKLSLVPFHLWTPDVYQGAPAPVSAFLATVSKLGVFAVLVRLMTLAPAAQSDSLLTAVAAIAFASMLIGNLLALRQNNIKRILGYSAIAHMGYLLTAVVAGGSFATETVGVYFATYVIAMLGAFGVVTLVSSPYSGTDAGDLQLYRGLFWRRPRLALALAVMMLSLAGIPLTVGFIGKFYALAVGVKSGLWWLVGAIVVGSGIGLYYYLRVAVTLFLAPSHQTQRETVSGWGPQSGKVMILLIAAAAVLFGVYPQPIITLIKAAVAGLAGH